MRRRRGLLPGPDIRSVIASPPRTLACCPSGASRAGKAESGPPGPGILGLRAAEKPCRRAYDRSTARAIGRSPELPPQAMGRGRSAGGLGGDCTNRRKGVQRSLASCGEGEKSMRERDRPVLVVDGDDGISRTRRARAEACRADRGRGSRRRKGTRALDDTPERGRARGRVGGRGRTRGLSRASRATRRGPAGDHGLERPGRRTRSGCGAVDRGRRLPREADQRRRAPCRLRRLLARTGTANGTHRAEDGDGGTGSRRARSKSSTCSPTVSPPSPSPTAS